jgi:hypothetical protein
VRLAEALPTRWTGPASFGGTGGLACPVWKIEFARRADSTGVEAATTVFAQARATIGSLGLLE